MEKQVLGIIRLTPSINR
jgi:hypothetical protein